MRKVTLIIISALLVVALFGLSAQTAPTRAEGQPSSDFPVAVEITGVIQTITVSQISLTDGTVFKINKQTKGLSSDLTAGVTITVTAQLDDEDLVAMSIVLGEASDSADVTATPEATLEATPAATSAVTNKGKGKGQGDTEDQGNGKGNGKGKGKGNGQGDNEDQDNGNGKGNGNGNGNSNGNGKGNGKNKNQNDQKVAACLKNTKHPVATRLAIAFSPVTYTEIMTWHCNGKGFGEITRAYLIAKMKLGTITVADIFKKRDGGEGWGQIMKELGVNPKDLAAGVVIKGNKGNKDKGDKGDNGNNGDNGNKGDDSGND